MKHIRPPSHAQRIQRLLLWATLWLAWVGEFIAGVAVRFRATRFLETPALAALLSRVTNIVCFLLLIEAMQRVGRRVANNGRFTSRAQIARAFLGGALRRWLATGDIAERIAKLARLLRSRAATVARLARRVARGFTRTHVFTAHRETAPTFFACAYAPLLRDSS